MVLRPLSYLGAARPLMLPLLRLLAYLYLPDRSTAYTGLVLRQLWLHSGFSREPTSANMLAELSHIWL
jgi:hypothetical protein